MARGALSNNLLNRRVRAGGPLVAWPFLLANGKPSKSACIVAAWTEQGKVMVAVRGPCGQVCEFPLTILLLADQNDEFYEE